MARLEFGSFEFLINKLTRLINEPAHEPKRAKVIHMTTTAIRPYIPRPSPIQL
jgi:hypothetical protein